MTGIRTQFLDSITSYGLTKIVNEIAQNENVDISDIEYIDIKKKKVCKNPKG